MLVDSVQYKSAKLEAAKHNDVHNLHTYTPHIIVFYGV